ncbi:thiol reductant ABC exporter subunit CydC [Barrientosiimonas humi]|uniref:thiol reductant ABC exporter subunit CydC n=1 Tax=Barrientosiimonas humi TaxID=999931 RepID=UPI00370D4E5A
MRPFDPRLLRAFPETRSPLAVLGALGVVGGLLAVGQAFALAALVVALVEQRSLATPAVALVVLLAARGLVAGGQELAAARAGSVVASAVRRRRLGAWLRRPAEQRADAAAALTDSTDGAAAIEPYVARYLPTLVAAAVVPAATLIALAWVDWLSALIVLLTLPLLPVFAALIGQHTRDETQARWRESVTLAGHFLDVVRGLPTLVSFGRADAQLDQVDRVGDRHRRATLRTLRTAFLSSAALELLATISVAIVAVAVGLRLAHGSMALGVGLTAILLAPEAYWPVRRVGQEFHAAADGAEALDRLLADEPGDASGDVAGDASVATTAATSASTGGPGSAPQQVVVRDVSYRHPGAKTVALQPVSFTAGRGLTVVSGPSGVGKSTLLEVVAGVRTASTGTVERPAVHLVTQQPFVAPMTTSENLALGTRAAADQVSLLPGVPSGAVLGDDGFGLSAGQRARLALERARLSDAAVLLADEPTAHLDEGAAAALRDELVTLGRSRVVIAVTHDPELLALADQVVELQAPHAGAADEPSPAGARAGEPSPHGVRAGEPTPHGVRVGEPPRASRIETSTTGLDTASASAPAYSTSVGAPAYSTSVGAPAYSTSVRAPASPTSVGAPARSTAARSPRRPLLRPTRGTLVAGALGGLAAASSVALTATSGWLIVRAAEQPVILTLIVAIVLVRTFGIARPVFRYAERVRSHDAALAELSDRRTSAYRALIPLTPARLGRRRRADLLTGFVRDLDDEVDAQVRVVVPLVAATLAGVGATVVAGSLLPPAALVIAAALVAAAVVAGLDLAGELAGQRDSVAARAGIARAAHVATTKTTELQAISATGWALDQLDEAQAQAERAALRQARGRALGATATPVVTGLATAAMAYVVAGALADGQVIAPIAALLLLMPLALGDVLGTLPDAMGAWARSRAARDRVADLLDQEPAVADTPGLPDLPPATSRTLGTDEVVAAWHPDSARITLPDSVIRPGEHLAITGPNGCGKSTMLSVLARHLDPVSGRSTIDGHDAQDVSLASARAQVAVVDDEPHLFTGTVRANLLLARPGADDTAVRDALTRAGLGSWLAGLPDGLDTDLGAGGRGMSGGERSRFAIARALLSDRPVLLLDEPVAHLDQPTARRVLTDLHTATRGRTVALVTHQALGLDGCDRHLRWTVAARTERTTT